MKLLSIFLLVGFVFNSCSTKSDQDLFSDGAKYFEEDKIPESIAAYEKVVKDFPDSKLAPKALTQLAGMYHGKKVQTLSERESLQKADSLFYIIFEKYPSSEEAPLGLFMAGFIQANELEDYQKATATYNTFIEQYPNHDLFISAKEELDNMGLSPEEILRKNLAQQE